MILYLSGPMSGLPDLNHPEFHRLAAELRGKGYEVISPAEIIIPEYPFGYTPTDEAERIEIWRRFMRLDIKALMDCDAVAVMQGWDKSGGAGIEVSTAVALGMEIIDAHTLEPIWLDVNVNINVREKAAK